MINNVTLFSKHKSALNSNGDMDVEVCWCMENSPESNARLISSTNKTASFDTHEVQDAQEVPLQSKKA
eukprot:scaffold13046_cov89-Skeletonema_dohrnii-CCMP3373.AAC.2